MVTRKERQEKIKQIPWVNYVKDAHQCDSLRNGTPLKAVFSMYGRPPVDQAPYRCKTPAHWRFRALKRSYARDGIYCMSHLIYRCLYGDTAECNRMERWQKRVMGGESDGSGA